MKEVGVRALKQNASAVVSGVAESGEGVIVTDRGRPVAQILPLSESVVERKLAEGLARGPRRSIKDLPKPAETSGNRAFADLSSVLEDMREGERF